MIFAEPEPEPEPPCIPSFVCGDGECGAVDIGCGLGITVDCGGCPSSLS